jgi:hypothetical protein
MTYLLALQKAIAQTQPDSYFGPMAGGDLYVPEYLEGWSDVYYDLIYSIDLQSETAAKIHLSNWDTGVHGQGWDANTQGYIDRIKKINEILLDSSIQSA